MRKDHCIFLRVLAMGLTLWFIAASGVFAQSEEISLPRADELIKEKRYDAAIQVLTEYGKQHPQEFDKVQSRLQGIVKARDEYNVLTERLLEVLRTDPNNLALILSLSRQIENLEIAPNPVIAEFIRRTKELTLFAHNQTLLDTIFAEGRAFLNRREYAAAVSSYASGTTLYREEFYEAQFGNLVYSQVESDIRTVNQGILNFAGIQERVLNTLSEFEEIAGANPDVSELDHLSSVFSGMESAVNDLMILRNSLAHAAVSLQNQSDVLRKIDDSRGDASYLPFMLRLIEGRPTEAVPEGILGTIDTLWLYARNGVLSSLIELADNNYRNALSLGKQNQFSESEEKFGGVMAFNDMILKTICWENQKEALKVPVFIAVEGEIVPQDQVNSYYQYYALTQSVPHIIAAQHNGAVFMAIQEPGQNSLELWQAGLLTAADAMPREEHLLLQYINFEQNVHEGLAALEETGNDLNTIRHEILVNYDYNIYLNEARSNYNSLLSSAFTQEKASVQRRYVIANSELDTRRAQRQSELDEANALIAGVSRESSGVRFLAKYPTEANTIFSRLLRVIPDDIQSGNNVIQQYAGELSQIRDTPEIMSLQATSRTILAGLESIQASAQNQSMLAQNMAGEAGSLKLDGDRLVQAALAAMNQNNFETARDQLRRASEQYDESLRIQESEPLRALRDNQLINYYDEINRRENVIILVQVRQLVDRAKSNFNVQEFERADDALSEAKTLYLRTNSEPNEEIAFWQAIVRNALSLRSGTTIPSTAPLYSEMSQLLRDAYQYYETGNDLFSRNQRSDGTARLNEARQKLQEVRLVFPLNAEAGILGLRIDQLIDPAFNQKFRSQLDTAFQAVVQTRSIEAYATLKNLAVIDPNYPGIRNMLYDAGVAMGEIIPPPSAADIARANQLNAFARQIIDSNMQAQFPAALEILNEAIQLNPDNNTTAQLIDRVGILMGGTSTIMVNEDKEKYNAAVREFQMGNRLVAQRLVDELLTNPRNRNSFELIQLKERIEAFL